MQNGWAPWNHISVIHPDIRHRHCRSLKTENGHQIAVHYFHLYSYLSIKLQVNHFYSVLLFCCTVGCCYSTFNCFSVVEFFHQGLRLRSFVDFTCQTKGLQCSEVYLSLLSTQIVPNLIGDWQPQQFTLNHLFYFYFFYKLRKLIQSMIKFFFSCKK